jgi:hypothetical protein
MIRSARGVRELTFVSIRKHPLRHLASFVTNDLFKARELGARSQLAAFQSRHWDEILAFVVERAKRLLKFYDDLEQLKATDLKGCEVIAVKYDDVISDPASALGPTLEQVGLAYQPSMIDYSTASHHPIGGNLGPHAQRAMKKHIPFDWRGEVAQYRKDFYSTTSGMTMDNKYQETFSPAQVALIEELEPVREVMRRLTYSRLS